MSDWYQTIADEAKTKALATLTEISAEQYFTVVQSLKINIISEAIKAIQGDLTRVAPPYLICQLGTDKVPSDTSPAARYYRIPRRWFYIIDPVTAKAADATLDAPAYARSRLELLRVAEQAGGAFTTHQWTGEDGEIDSSEDVAFASENMDLFAAQLSYETGFLTLVK